MKYYIKYFLFIFLIICHFSCDNNNSDLVKKSIKLDDIEISFKIPKDYTHEIYEYCDSFLEDVFSFSNKKLIYICSDQFYKDDTIDSLGDQFLIIIYDNIKFKDDYFENYLEKLNRNLSHKLDKTIGGNTANKMVNVEKGRLGKKFEKAQKK